jgi:UDP-glucuronate 4-epimerase
VAATYANVDALADWTGLRPHTPLKEGIQRFAQWYLAYYPQG